MVLQSEFFSGGYNQQSCPQDSYYYSSGYGHGPSMHMGPTPSFNSPHMMYSGKHGPQHHTTPDFHTNGSNMHMSPVFSAASNLSHGMPTNGYVSSHHGADGNFSHGMESGGYGSSYHGGSNHEMPTGNYGSSYHGRPTESYGNSYHGAKHSPMGSKLEAVKHEYDNYNYGHSNMVHNPMHGGHQSAEWKAKSIEDDD